MEHFDPYAAYSEPRTPSPHDILFPNNDYKHHHHIEPRIYDGQDDVYRGSLLQELYDHDLAEQQQQQQHQQQHWQQQQQQQHWQPQPYPMARRATFPYVRQDRDDYVHHHQYPLYSEPIPESHEFIHHYDDSNPSIKLEDPATLTVPSHSQPSFYPSPTMSMSYLPTNNPGLPVQLTDDAASKETQFLRRRCFNCHTTEPPSWRRSTLNPGKIVCNKCGLYERTHLRPRPLRFDELRAGNKARTGKAKGAVSPKAKLSSVIKKEPREFGITRRSSVSSASSVHSSSGASDWDDNVSVYSSGSNPPTSFNSPDPNTVSLELERDSQSPPLLPMSDAIGIRLPNASLSDISSSSASSSAASPIPAGPTPRKAHTAPVQGDASYYSPPGSSAGLHSPEFIRPGSVTASPLTRALEICIPPSVDEYGVEESLVTAVPIAAAS
ncbi:hypothetical protein H0H93_009505 [Arthromyces matolae]|nr:hypothetical protein H0H93_009505 [Arthromyces matolae]